ncbi:MAG: patatin-like phospholipase family protein [Thermoanaerobaculia bacterium]
MSRDLILSSGFLAFARHVGFLRAVEDSRIQVGAVCGTSSGALVGALWAAGWSADEIGSELSAHRPIRWLRPSLRPWRGLVSIRPLVSRLRELLPASFAELERPLGVGVMGPRRSHRLLSEGPLPAAVAASCAIPIVFQPVVLGGVGYCDGGAADRLGLDAWRRWRPERAGLVHCVERTRGRDVTSALDGLEWVRTPPSGASFFSLGDFSAQVEESRRQARETLAPTAT